MQRHEDVYRNDLSGCVGFSEAQPCIPTQSKLSWIWLTNSMFRHLGFRISQLRSSCSASLSTATIFAKTKVRYWLRPRLPSPLSARKYGDGAYDRSGWEGPSAQGQFGKYRDDIRRAK